MKPLRVKLLEFVENLLWNKTPRIAVSGAGSFLPFPPNKQPDILINSSQLEPGEEKIIADSEFEVLSHPPAIKRNNAPAAVDITGDWNVEIQFAAGADNQKLALKQNGSEITGIHYGSYDSREIAGTLNGSELLLRSAYKKKGVRISFEFTGTASDKTMEGSLVMGEYGLAEWKATRLT